MKIQGMYLVHLFCLFITLMILAGFQTAFWPQVFGHFPPPLIWLNALIYICLYRKPYEAILVIYIAGIFLKPFTVMPIGIYWLVMLVLSTLIVMTKQRVFWPGKSYFSLACLITGVFYHVFQILFSFALEQKQIASLDFLSRLSQIIITPLFAVPVFWIFNLVDKLTKREPLPEQTGGGYE